MQTIKNPTVPGTLIQSGIKRPAWLCSKTRQLVILLRDASGSMKGVKAADASAASRDLVDELSNPQNKDAFRVAIVDFADDASVTNNLVKATMLQGKVSPIATRANTNITAGLEAAVRIIEDAKANPEPGLSDLRPVVVLFSDGCHNSGPEPLGPASTLKAEADVVTCAFGSDADENMLRDIASTPQHAYRTTNGRELRQFLAVVGKTLTATLTSGKNATRELTTLRLP